MIGGAISASQRDALLLLLAAYHRLLRIPAFVELDAAPVAEALPALFGLVETLIDRADPGAEGLQAEVARARRALARERL